MRRLAILCLTLISTSLVLAPFGTLHVHVDVDHHVLMHGGHVHTHSDDGDEHEAIVSDQIIDMSVATIDVGIKKPTSPTPDAMPLALFVLFLGLPYLTSILRPPTHAPPLPSRRNYRHPPLRGPPAISI